MMYRALSDTYAVAPQIAPTDIPELAAQGFTTVICNRPDTENPPELAADVLRVAVEAAGLEFRNNPIVGGGLMMDDVTAQADAIEADTGKVLAYCASGTRSAIMWCLAVAGKMPTDDIIAATDRAGYALDGMRGQIDMLAAQK